jgi:hypothetical protein
MTDAIEFQETNNEPGGSEGQAIQRTTGNQALLGRQLGVELVTGDDFWLPFDAATGAMNEAEPTTPKGMTGVPAARQRGRRTPTAADYAVTMPVFRNRVG